MEVQLGVRVPLDRHLRLLKVLRHHVELGQGQPTFHHVVDGWLQPLLHKVQSLLFISPIRAVGADQATVEEEGQELLAPGDLALWHIFVARVDHEVRVLVIHPKIELFSRRAPPILLLDIDWEAEVVDDVERLVTLVARMAHNEQVVVAAHV